MEPLRKLFSLRFGRAVLLLYACVLGVSGCYERPLQRPPAEPIVEPAGEPPAVAATPEFSTWLEAFRGSAQKAEIVDSFGTRLDEATPFLLSALDGHRAPEAARILAEFPAVRDRTLSRLRERMATDDHGGVESARAVWKLDPAAADGPGRIVTLLSSTDDDVREAAVATLEYYPYEEAPIEGIITQRDPLAAVLDSEDPNVRRAAITALSRIGAGAASVERVAQYAETAADRAQQAAALSAMGRAGVPALETLERWLRDPSMRAPARRAIRTLPGGLASRFRESMLEALREATDPRERTEIATALSYTGVDACIEGIRELTKESAARVICVDAIPTYGKEAAVAVPVLIACLTDASSDVRYSAAYALSRIGPAAAEAAPALEKSLSDPENSVRVAAVLALQAVVPERAEELPSIADVLTR